MNTIKSPRKLIEVALPLDAINEAAAYEKMPGIGAHPRGLHLWWARRPLAAARAVIFAGRAPIGPLPKDDIQTEHSKEWPGATGLAEDVRRYGAWMRSEPENAYERDHPCRGPCG
ncbi:MAG: hypothetical protein A2268_02710 [Candidatus Raymondbacteria bacterium RifOxyA12_full_50_37]|nr:MAG: hypothetical protein A2268_02710 [Candidatus Raymondbacteria bacterium RifOxyA12_full_50_37]OGJ96662.1 MAG: hypothetical protein A2453_06645 [Candidatus Raymondbacteria bacterium RIFOXYC2_FULL_50_21]OGK00093.1 MAG: hypothetical protein A2487_04965 [Candidatus Raymondbacteria bacterium RifOxyC12_full_50_8]